MAFIALTGLVGIVIQLAPLPSGRDASLLPASLPTGTAVQGSLAAAIGAAPRVGAPAPTLALNDAEARLVSLDALRGRTVLLNFWASWCPPCEKEMTDLQTLYAEEAGRDFIVVGVNEGEEPGRAQEFLRAKGITFPTVFDTTGDVARRYEIFGLPNSFFVDANGVVRARVVGPFSLDQMREHIARVRAGFDVTAPPAVSLFGAMAAENDRPVAQVRDRAITLGEVHRRIDLEAALATLRGGLPPDLTLAENSAERHRLYREFAERLVDERVIAARAVTVAIDVPSAEIEADLQRLAGELGLTLEQLADALSNAGSDVRVLRDVQHAARLIGRFAAERILTGMTDEGIDEYEPWLSAARRAADARILIE